MDAKRGQMRHLEAMQVEINGERMQLAPGAQIRDRANMIVLPGALPPESLVKYTRNPQGQIARVWILTPQEAAQPDPVTK
jgi:predicted YcjX-like family ATPase